MKIEIKKVIAEKIGTEALAPFGFFPNQWYRNSSQSINLVNLTKEQTLAFKVLLSSHQGQYGIGPILRDVEAWLEAVDNTSTAKVSSLKALVPLLVKHFRDVPGQRFYERDGEAWLCHYVKDIEYHPPRRDYNYTVPAYVELSYAFLTLEGVQEGSYEFREHDVHRQTVTEILTNQGIYIETESLRATYDHEIARFKKIIDKIGGQYVCTGEAICESEDNNWWWRRVRKLQLKGARVLVDVFYENKEGDEAEEDESGHHWERERRRKAKEKVIDNSFWKHDQEAAVPVDLPIHPIVKVFHLGKHMRMTTHVSNLKRYKYDASMIDKLVIDDTRKALVRLLIEHRSTKYQDIISTKSGGAIVMLCGAPGTGKTLTAEVFAESEKRPLYSVQCSQLGVTPDELETELMKVLTRAARWNAVLLLDEADVYVHKRGTDIHQNAMVGVFLRVLEYQDAIMFLTTNRADDIDDAVSSRCTAKLNYDGPAFEAQCKIWRVLASVAGAKMSEKTIAKVAKAYPTLVGRDIKQLLKLGMLVSGGKITSKTIAFVHQFKSS